MAERGDERAVAVGGAIIKVDPRFPEEFLFKQMSYQYSRETTLSELPKIPEVERVRQLPDKVAIVLHHVLFHYMGSMLGGQIISPQFGMPIYLDRIAQIVEMLISVAETTLASLVERIQEGRIEPEEVAEKVEEALEWVDITFIVAREAMNRKLTAVHINAPPQLRPPLVNIKIGYSKEE